MEIENINNYFNYINLERKKWTKKSVQLTIKESFLNNTMINPGQIWICDLGKNTGSELNNKRPVVILQKHCNNSKTVIIVPISNKQKKYTSHVHIEDDLYEIKNGNIQGTISTEHIREVSIARLQYMLGNMTKKGMDKVLIALLDTIFGLKRTKTVLDKLNI